MAIIREYQPDTNPSGPFETRQARDMDTGNVGGAMEHVGTGLEQLGDTLHRRDVQNEISDISARLSSAHAKFTDDLHDTLKTADPADGTISSKFMEKYDDQMSDVGGKLSTPEAQRYFQRANAQMRAHFMVQSSTGQAALAGEKAVEDIKTEHDNYSSSLLKDPDSFETVRNLAAASIQEKVAAGFIPKAKASEIQREMNSSFAQSSLQGMISNGRSQQALDSLKGGAWGDYLDGQTTFKMQKEAEQGINAERIQKDRQDALARQAQQQAQDATQSAFLSRLQPDADKPLTAQDILKSNLDNFGSGSKDQFLKMMKASSEEKIKTDPQVYLGLAQRIGLPDGDPNKITDRGVLYDAFTKGNLTHQSLNELTEELRGGKSDEGQQLQLMKNNFMQIAKDRLTKTQPMLGLKDPDGDERYQMWMSDFNRQFNAGIKAGKSPQSMITPGTPDYLGNTIQTYQRSTQEILKSMTAPVSSNAPSSTTTQSVPSAAASTGQQGAGRQGGAVAPQGGREKNPPPGLTFEQFQQWKKNNGG